jgi:phosphoglucosamine mutase
MDNLFGTDGIRGRAGEFPLCQDFVVQIGSAIARAIPSATRSNERIEEGILIGRDTRASGEWIERALTTGLTANGMSVLSLGVLPTPGVAYMTRAMNARCGISISASHNPYEDNGIKIFGSDGFKIPDEIESEIERISALCSSTGAGRKARAAESGAYDKFLLNAVPGSILRGKRVAVDCNNGATYNLAPRVLRELGAEIVALNVEPNGTNINLGYDALEPQSLREAVLHSRADWGVQLDGDGDRAVFVDELGNYLDGDFILAIFARDWVDRGTMNYRAVVSTVMANAGLGRALEELGVKLDRVQVGDRWVTERMRASGAVIGGEQAGHIILLDGGHTTGDGIYTAVRLAEIAARKNATLSALAAGMKKYPQVLLNVRVPRKPPLENFPHIQSQVERARAALGDGARINVRYSGTENLARVMIEGSDAARIAQEANAIARVIQESIN